MCQRVEYRPDCNSLILRPTVHLQLEEKLECINIIRAKLTIVIKVHGEGHNQDQHTVEKEKQPGNATYNDMIGVNRLKKKYLIITQNR